MAAETIEVVPLVETTDNEIDTRQLEISELVSDSEVQTHLRALHLPGVIARHERTQDSTWPPERGLTVTRQKMQEGELSAYMIIQRTADRVGRLVGMASIQPGIELRRQFFPLPPRVARRIPLMSLPIIRDEGSVNFSAWVDPRLPDQKQPVYTAYAYLREPSLQKGLPWTLLPDSSVFRHPYYDAALYMNGFEIKDTGYYDDQEIKDGRLPRVSLYLPVTNNWDT
jgi:hypothetical protein